MAALRRPPIRRTETSSDFAGWMRASIALKSAEKPRQKRKTRPGGQPDGSSHMGAWGGWALAPNTASMGRDNRSHIYLSRKGRRTFKPAAIFLTFRQQVPERFQAGTCPPGSRNGNRFGPEKPVKSAIWRAVLIFWTRRRRRPRLELTARRSGWPWLTCRRPWRPPVRSSPGCGSVLAVRGFFGGRRCGASVAATTGALATAETAA